MERRHLRWVSALETLEILNAPRSPRFTSKPTSYLEQRRLIYQQSEMSLGRAAPRSLLLIGHQSIPKNRLTFLFHFVARSHQLELTTPGDMVYLKHSPAMRSYVVLRGTVLLTNSVMDREGVEVSRNDFLRCGMPSLSFPLNEPLLHGCASLHVELGTRKPKVSTATESNLALLSARQNNDDLVGKNQRLEFRRCGI